MKRIFFIATLLSVFLLAGAQESYVMYETMYMKPKADKLEEFNDALAAHNKKFHAEGASKVFIRYVINGPHAGEYVWVMGPTTWTDLDNRPDDKAHTDDWNKVAPLLDEVSEVEYWRMDDKLSYFPEGYDGSSKIHVRAWDVKPGKWDETLAVLKQVTAVYEDTKDKNPWMIYYNQFQTGNGRDVSAVVGFEKWAEYDEESTWVKDFERVNGEGSWDTAMEFMRENTTMTEEVRELVPELSGTGSQR